jgi:hypothetical protein
VYVIGMYGLHASTPVELQQARVEAMYEREDHVERYYYWEAYPSEEGTAIWNSGGGQELVGSGGTEADRAGD